MGRSNINRGSQRLDELRARAEERRVERDKRSAAEQISLLDQRFGEGAGAKKERAKLQRMIDADNAQKNKKKAERDAPERKPGRDSKQTAKERRRRERSRSRRGAGRERASGD